MRLALSWLFLTFLSFLAFSGVVTALSTFFLSEDLRLLLAAPVSSAPALLLAASRGPSGQASWMVVVFLLPVLLGGRARPLRGAGFYYLAAVLTVAPFVVIPVTLGALVTLLLVNVFPARRARDVLMLMGLLFAVVLVLMLRFLQPEQLLKVESLPDITGFFATLQSPVTPLLPSFWAGETLFAAPAGPVRPPARWAPCGRRPWRPWCWPAWRFGRLLLPRLEQGPGGPQGALHAPAAGSSGWSTGCPSRPPSRQLLLKDLKVFLRDTTQWSQLLLLLALALVYLYNFRVLDLDRVPYMSGVVKNAYAFVNLGLAAFVLAAVAVRFVFPAVSAEGAAFWVVRTSPVSLRAFLLVEVRHRAAARAGPGGGS